MQQMTVSYILVFTFSCFSLLFDVLAVLPHRKFEYKYSFKPPYLAQKDGTVPFWEYGGNAIASADNVRVAPSLKSQKGAIWSKSKTNFPWWEVELVFRVTGRGRIGADGLAFWFTNSKGSYDGNVYGSSDQWVGLGVFFDSFDNDNQHNNPYIMAMVNDGTKQYDHAKDGSLQMLAGCIKDFRNKPFPTRAKIEYYLNTLTVFFHNGMTNNEQDYELCLRAENVLLPQSGHFGVSAATGGLADDHDVIHFLTTSLHPPGQAPLSPGGSKVTMEEENKLTQEYAEYQKKLDIQKEEYKKTHPGSQVNDPQGEFDDWFESDDQREYRQIYSGILKLQDQVSTLSPKFDEVIGRQERVLSMISMLQQHAVAGGVPQIPQHQAGVPPAHQPMMIDTIRRAEVDAVLTNQNTIINSARELRNFVIELTNKADRILEKQERSPTAQVVGYDSMAIVKEIREALNGVKRDTETVAARVISPGVGATQCPSCVTPMVLILAISAHLIILFVYFMYRDSKESSAKKFY